MVDWPAIPVLYLLDTTWSKNGMTHCEDEAMLKEVVNKPPATVHSFVDTLPVLQRKGLTRSLISTDFAS